GALESLLKDKEKLKAVLLYHVAAGTLKASDVVATSSIATVGGGTLAVSTAGGVKVNASNVVLTDVSASNGVIHVIDTVLLPS
ncbi:MAG TPA: fasciclin domain-containing protein, partial [Gemmatimonadaceae bacterium]|nr:fasciclin domain-containing protein [Gemmatimonadaceae bacterium]